MSNPTREQEIQRLEKKRDRLGGELAKTRKQLLKLYTDRERANAKSRLRDLVGVPGGVKARFSVPASDRWAWMNDATGTLTEMRRTRGTVDYGGRGKWNLQLDELMPAGAEREGFTLQFGNGND